MDTGLARQWVARWDAQQEFYVADREERFTVIADVIAHVTTGQECPRIADLGCGPGSTTARIAARLPGARITGYDADPFLLALASGAHPGLAEFVDADLTVAELGGAGELDAAVSTTALHWLTDADLAALYRRLAAALRSGGVLVNGDHLFDAQPAIATLAHVVRDARADRAGVRQNEDWHAWWDAAAAEPAFADLLAEREVRRGAATADHGQGHALERHVELLREAGFSQVGPVWRVGDDTVLVAVR